MYNEKFEENAKMVAEHIPNIDRLYNKRIFITGGTGMICSAVSDILFYLNKSNNANIQIVFAGRKRESIEQRFYDKNWEFVKFDATKPYNTLSEVDYAIYGASNADPGAISKYPVETIMSNVSGLNDVFKNTKAARYLYISSGEVYGNGSKAPYKETDYGYVDILNMRACYPISKRMAENLCISYAEEYNKDIVIVRPSHTYGPTITKNDNRASAVFSRMAASGVDIVMKTPGSQLRSYTYVYDCASAILAVLINGKNKNAYNIASRQSVCTIKDMAEALAKEAGVNIVIDEASETEKKSYNLMTNSSLDSEKIESIGWKAYIDLEKGAHLTIDNLKTIKYSV